MHLQVTTQGQPTLVAFVSLASEDPEEHRRQMARPFVFRNIHLRLASRFQIASLSVCDWVTKSHHSRSGSFRIASSAAFGTVGLLPSVNTTSSER